MIKPKVFRFNDLMELKGLNLMGDVTYLKIGDNEYELDPLNPNKFVSNDTIKFKLEESNLNIGIHAVQINQKLMLGLPPKEHEGFLSNNLSIHLSPKLGVIKFINGLLEFSVTPQIVDGQKCEIILSELTQKRTEYRIDFSDEVKNGLLNNYFVSKPAKINPGQYLVRLKIDNLYSKLDDDYNGPIVQI